MKVLYLSHEDSRHGAPKSLMEMMKSLMNDHGVEPICAVHSKDEVFNYCISENIKVFVTGHYNFVCGRQNKISSYIKYLPKKIVNRIFDRIAYYILKKLIDFKELDIVHSNVSIVSLGCYIKKRNNVVHVMHLREPADTYKAYLFTKKTIHKLFERKC